MDLQALILDYIFTERAGVIAFLATFTYFIFQQNKTLSTIEKELVSLRDKVNRLVNRTDDTTSDISSLSSRISNLSGAVSDATTVAEGTKKELSMLAEGINSETVFNEAIDEKINRKKNDRKRWWDSPSPNCCRLLFVQTQSYQGGTAGRKGLHAHCPELKAK